MGRFKKFSVVFLIVGIIVTAVILSSCTLNVTPPPTPTPQTYLFYQNEPTGQLNCAG